MSVLGPVFGREVAEIVRYWRSKGGRLEGVIEEREQAWVRGFPKM